MKNNTLIIIACILVVSIAAALSVYFIMKQNEDDIKKSFSGAYVDYGHVVGTDDLGGTKWSPTQNA